MKQILLRSGRVHIEFKKDEMSVDEANDVYKIVIGPEQVASIVRYYVQIWARKFGMSGGLP